MLSKVDKLVAQPDTKYQCQWSIGNEWYLDMGWCLADTEKMVGQKMVSRRRMGNASRILRSSVVAKRGWHWVKKGANIGYQLVIVNLTSANISARQNEFCC